MGDAEACSQKGPGRKDPHEGQEEDEQGKDRLGEELSSRALPRLLEVWLSYVPPAVLSALVAPSLLVDQEKISLAPGNVFLWASIPTVIVAWKTKNFPQTRLRAGCRSATA